MTGWLVLVVLSLSSSSSPSLSFARRSLVQIKRCHRGGKGEEEEEEEDRGAERDLIGGLSSCLFSLFPRSPPVRPVQNLAREV